MHISCITYPDCANCGTVTHDENALRNLTNRRPNERNFVVGFPCPVNVVSVIAFSGSFGLVLRTLPFCGVDCEGAQGTR